MIDTSNITAVILAGGKGRRLGGKDKGLVELNNQPLISYVISAIASQAGQLLINANRNTEKYAVFGYPVISDAMEGFQGPLAGFLSAMRAITTSDMVSVPCDGPRLPPDLVTRLVKSRVKAGAEIAVAHDGMRLQPVYALIPVNLQLSLQAYLESGERKIDRWYAMHNVTYVNFSDVPETFVNINTAHEWDQFQKGIAAA